MKLPKKIAALLTVTLVASSAGNLSFADTVQGASSEQLTGSGRWETAIEISKKGWEKASEAVIVNDGSIADALAATPFAEAKNAPILLTGKDSLNKETKEELKRLGVEKVYIIGGENTLTKNVEDLLIAEGLEVDRIQGDTRELTALEIAKRLDEIKPISEIAVVNGTKGLADAVSIAATAAHKDMAIILSNSNEGTKASDEFIKSKNIKASYVIGGENSVSNEVLSNLPNAERIEGSNRSETNAKVIETFYTEKDIKNAYVAKDGMGNENNLIDALAVGVLAAKNDSPVIIVGNKLDQMQKDVTNTKSFKTVTQVGGNGNETAFGELKTMQGVTTYEVTTVEELNEALKKADANDVINVKSLKGVSRTGKIEISTNNAVNINLYDEVEASVVVDVVNGTLVAHGEHDSIDIKGGDLVIEGTVGSVNVLEGGDVTVSNNNSDSAAPNIVVEAGASVAVEGNINTITVNGQDAQVSVGESSTVSKVEVSENASGTVIENAGTVDSVESDAPNVNIENNGTVGEVSGSNIPNMAWDGITKAEVTPVDGVYEITTASQLAWVADFVNAGNTTISIKLMNDIDLNNKEWTPIGTSSKHFRGSFDGGNHTIKNLSINNEASSDLGLFGYTNSGINVKNVTLDGVNIVGNQRIGSLVGSIFDEQTSSTKEEIIENCHVKNVNLTAKKKDVAGLVGYGYVDIKDCSVDEAIITAKTESLNGDNVGGAIGYLASKRTVSNVKVNNVTLSGERKVGGVAGSANDANIVFENCEVTGNTSIEARALSIPKAILPFAGGIVGETVQKGITVKDCFVDKSTVKISGKNNKLLGWFVGGSRANDTELLKYDVVNFVDTKDLGCSFRENNMSDEFKLFETDASFSTSNINIGITLNDDMNIALKSSDNITIQYLDGNDKVITSNGKMWSKDKTWAGYLNDADKNKYGKGLGIGDAANYSNELKAGVRYSTTLYSKDLDPKTVAKVKVIVKMGDETQEVVLENTLYEKPEVELFDVDSMFSTGTIDIGIVPAQDMNIGLLTKDSITISYLREDDTVVKTKDKTWAGYLNDAEGNKYGNGTKAQGTYSNELKAGVRYTTAVNAPFVGSNILEGFEEVAKVKVVVKVGDLTQEVVLENTAK